MIQNVEKLYDLIEDCQVRRLTTQESLDYIKRNGIKLSERTYRRYKKELEDKTQERILEEGERVYESEFLRRLDSIKRVEKEYWTLFSNTKNEPLKEKILQSIRDTLEVSEGCYKDVKWRSYKIRQEMEKSQDQKLEYDRREKEKEQKSRHKLDSLTN